MSRERSLYGKEEIIKVAIGIVENEGETALSARRIAKELGVSSMTIYNYVKNLNDIKKRVVISGFDRMYGFIYQAVSAMPSPVGGRDFCRVMAVEIFRFAHQHPHLFSYMFQEGRRAFHEDAEVRPFYTFLTGFMRRVKSKGSNWQDNEIARDLFETIVVSLSLQNAETTVLMTEQEFLIHINYYLERCIDD